MTVTPEIGRLIPYERHVAVNGTDLFVREIGVGPPVMVLHGGPDFDHTYLLPELDALADSCRLIYYDQRGRGRSPAKVAPEQVSIESEIADLDQLRERLGLTSIAVLGHSWGGVLAMEYATRHPDRISHLILMNTAPASGIEWEALRDHLRTIRLAGDAEEMAQIAASAGFRAGDPQVEVDYYRIYFRPAVHRTGQLEQIVGRLRPHFTAEGVRTARAIERRLYEQTWQRPGYDIVPGLADLRIPTLVLHGEHDLIPVGIASRIADAIPAAQFTTLDACGHFAYLESPDLVHQLVDDLLNTR